MLISENNAPVPENLNRIMNQKGLKQLFVAKQAGLTGQQMTDMLNGRRLIKVSDLLSLSDVLGVSVSDLCARAEPGGRWNMRYKKKAEFFVPTEGFIHATSIAQLITRPVCVGKKLKIIIDFDPESKRTYIRYYEEKKAGHKPS